MNNDLISRSDALKAVDNRHEELLHDTEYRRKHCQIDLLGIKKHILAIPPVGEWIPVSERLPEEHGYYLVTTDGSHNAVIDIAEYGKFYRKPENEYVLEWNKSSRVIAWQPLPEPYKKGDTE